MRVSRLFACSMFHHFIRDTFCSTIQRIIKQGKSRTASMAAWAKQADALQKAGQACECHC